MYQRNISIKFRGKEVRNPVLRAILGAVLAVLGVLTAVISVLVAALAVLALVITSPVWILVHFALTACGRKGFIQRSPGHINIKVGADGFRKRTTPPYRR
jgi:predicted small lipoprotein YifL